MYLSPLVNPFDVNYEQLALAVKETADANLDSEGRKYHEAYLKARKRANFHHPWTRSYFDSMVKRMLALKKRRVNRAIETKTVKLLGK